MLCTTRHARGTSLNVIVLLALLLGLLTPALTLAQEETLESPVEAVATEPPPATEEVPVDPPATDPPPPPATYPAQTGSDPTEEPSVTTEPVSTEVPAEPEPATEPATEPVDPVEETEPAATEEGVDEEPESPSVMVTQDEAPGIGSYEVGAGFSVPGLLYERTTRQVTATLEMTEWELPLNEYVQRPPLTIEVLWDGAFPSLSAFCVATNASCTLVGSGPNSQQYEVDTNFAGGSAAEVQVLVDFDIPAGSAGQTFWFEIWAEGLGGPGSFQQQVLAPLPSTEPADEPEPTTAPVQEAVISIDSVTCTENGGRIAGTVLFSGPSERPSPNLGMAIIAVDGSTAPNLGGYADRLTADWFHGLVPFDLAFPRLNSDGEDTNGSISIEAGTYYQTLTFFAPLANVPVDVSACFDSVPTEEPVTPEPTDEPEPAEVPTISEFTVNMPDACTFLGGAGTLTGTTRFSRAIAEDEPLWINLWIGWETPTGDIRWGDAHWGPNGAYWQQPLSINGPWSLSMDAYNEQIGGVVYGRERPADAQALVARLSIARQGGLPSDEEVLSWPVSGCGVEPEPTEPTEPPVTPVETDSPTTPATNTPVTTEPPVTEPPVETETPTDPPTEPPVMDGAEVPVSLALCANDDCTPPHRLDADGFTATWEFTRGAEDRRAIHSFFQVESESLTVTAVIQNGTANATSSRLATGSWIVCLQPVLSRADGATIRLFDGPQCETVSILEDGELSPVASALPASVPLVIEGGGPDVPAEPTADAPGSPSTPVAGADRGGSSSDSDSDAADRESVSGLPVTGAGAPEATSSMHVAVALVTAALVLAGVAAQIRRRT